MQTRKIRVLYSFILLIYRPDTAGLKLLPFQTGNHDQSKGFCIGQRPDDSSIIGRYGILKPGITRLFDHAGS
jgi:hypothetical protein